MKFQNFNVQIIILKNLCNIKIKDKKNLLLHLNLINMRFYGAEYNNIELGFASFNIVVLCSIELHIDLVQVQ